jgi:hypothetical protein
VNNWQKLFGKARAASDKALLQALERQIADEERAWNPDTAPVHQITEEQRRTIAAAFGRPPLFAKPAKRS